MYRLLPDWIFSVDCERVAHPFNRAPVSNQVPIAWARRYLRGKLELSDLWPYHSSSGDMYTRFDEVPEQRTALQR